MGAGALTRDVEPTNAERQRWLTLAEKALAGATFEEKLVSHTDDSIRVEPLYERATGTEPIVRVIAEAPTDQEAKELVRRSRVPLDALRR